MGPTIENIQCKKCLLEKPITNFNKDVRYKSGFHPWCKGCRNLYHNQHRQKEISSRNVELIECPICHQSFEHLGNHISRIHKLSKQQVQSRGIGKLITERVLNTKRHPHPTMRIGDKVSIIKNRITIPANLWPNDCKYLRIKVNKKMLRVEFNPLNQPQEDSKTISTHAPHSQRLVLKTPQILLDNLEIIRPLIELRNRAGFVIQFFEEDNAILDNFNLWATRKKYTKNFNYLTSYNNGIFLVDENIWPQNATYAFYEFNVIRKTRYLDIFPISPTGFIVSRNLDFKQYYGSSNVYKARKFHHRLRLNAIKFCKINKIPNGYWDLVKTLPSGALRFRLYQER